MLFPVEFTCDTQDKKQVFLLSSRGSGQCQSRRIGVRRLSLPIFMFLRGFVQGLLKKTLCKFGSCNKENFVIL